MRASAVFFSNSADASRASVADRSASSRADVTARCACRHHPQHRFEQQPVEQGRQQQHEENDPENRRRIREQRHLRSAIQERSAACFRGKPNIHLYHSGFTLRNEGTRAAQMT